MRQGLDVEGDKTPVRASGRGDNCSKKTVLGTGTVAQNIKPPTGDSGIPYGYLVHAWGTPLQIQLTANVPRKA